MKIILTLTILFLSFTATNAQTLYSQAFGNLKDQALIFLHGGPGYNCANFESSTAKNLSERGFYVIVYDRRGEGRSKDDNAAFTFQQTFDDLNAIYKQYELRKAVLVGHSFGGVVATLFAQKYPEKVRSVFLVGAPVSLQETFKTIINSCKNIYQTKNDTSNLRYLSMLEAMDTTSLQYSSYCFRHAMQNGFYTPKKMSEEAKTVYTNFRKDTTIAKYAGQMTFPAPMGFWKNEKYTTIDLSENLKILLKKNIRIYGLYGKDDGLYSPGQIEKLRALVGQFNVRYLDNCSHNVFMDDPAEFYRSLTEWGAL